MRALALLFAVLTAVVGLSACSGDDPGAATASASRAAQTEDAAVAAWRDAVEAELGTAAYDFDALRSAAAVDCLRTTSADWTVELALSGDTSTAALTRIGLEHACADVVGAFDHAVATVEQAADPLELVCGPGVELSDEAALVAEMACANR